MNESMDRAVADWLREGPESGPREALERKNKGASKPGGTKHGSEGHAPSAHGPEGGKREFRRKSGG